MKLGLLFLLGCGGGAVKPTGGEEADSGGADGSGADGGSADGEDGGPTDSGGGDGAADSGADSGDPSADADGDGWVASEDCDDDDAWLAPVEASLGGPVELCALGRELAQPADLTWSLVATAGSGSTATAVDWAEGCSAGGGLELQATLGSPTEDGAWVVLAALLPEVVDLSGEHFLMWTLAGDAANPAFSAELMLRDALDCTTRARIEDIASLPVERTVPIPLAWFARSSKGRDAGGEACTLDLSQVEALKLALSDAEGADEVTFFVDTLRVATADELRVADPGRFACPPADREDLQGQIAADLRAQVSAAQAAYGHALIPAWAEEPDPHYYIYSEALAIIALAGEHRRTGNPAMAEAAQALATDLTALEPESTGIWADLYLNADDPSPSDTGDTWPGNPAWVVIALDRLLEWAPPEDPSAIEGALQRGADWLLAQIATSEENPAITNGVEGNLSTWFALRAAERHFPDGGYGAAADGIDAWIDSRGRSEGLGLVWMGGGSPWLATDTAGSWGVDYLRARGLHEEALLSQRLGAGTMAVWDWERGAWGLGDIAGPWQPSWEFTAEYVAAGGLGGEELMTQIAAQMVDGRLAGSPEDFSGGGTWNTSWTGVSPAAWAWLALDGGFLHRL